ncbi:chromate transporter [Noviherbaspirillum saxi]|uniref:Chromate transporter n=1 Tax=Noviherbaspirillum saxi TaxID=2320863 RepID=A0A3A3FNW6_9BURK|nr:chromate transporter [Noviherbaspirillum saxi]RJF95369.1 chromate transporter [Noviherbaspirillum saxi]
MNTMLRFTLEWADWLNLFAQYLLLSLLSIGGAISTTAEMHRFLVDEHHWLTPSQFNASIAIAQAAPGPNVLFVALMGWNVGMNAGGWSTALFGVLVTMVGILLPSTTMTYLAAQWGHKNRDLRPVRAFKSGMAPIVIALLFSTSWTLASSNSVDHGEWKLWLAAIIAALVIWKTRVHLLILLLIGALLGWFGII